MYMGKINSRSRKILINAPKARRVKDTMYGMLLTGKYTITSVGRVVYHNKEEHHEQIARYNTALKDLRVKGACGVRHWRDMSRVYQEGEAPTLTGTLSQANMNRLNEIAQQIQR
jgi:3-phosphoglycerate kinase